VSTAAILDTSVFIAVEQRRGLSRPLPAELSAGRKPRVSDTWIAATALVHGAEVWTQDGDFTAFEAITIVRV
jgi:predicted nucleic acid-binding protein